MGAGKTYELIVVPNHITEQWAAEWLQLYPSANILVATKKDFETQNRKKFCSRIATGDYDAIIIGHSQFEKIPMSLERQQAILERQIEEILAGIEQAKAQKAERYTVKQMERTRKSLEARLAKLNDQSRKDDTGSLLMRAIILRTCFWLQKCATWAALPRPKPKNPATCL